MNLIYLPIIEQIDDTVFVLQTDFCMDATSKRSNNIAKSVMDIFIRKKFLQNSKIILRIQIIKHFCNIKICKFIYNNSSESIN